MDKDLYMFLLEIYNTITLEDGDICLNWYGVHVWEERKIKHDVYHVNENCRINMMFIIIEKNDPHIVVYNILQVICLYLRT